MKLRKALVQGIEQYLRFIPPKIVKRGRGYAARGDVVHVECVEADRVYKALVRGGMDYEVSLTFEAGRWKTECVCHLGGDCRHAVAALITLREQAGAKAKRLDSPGEEATTAGSRGRVARPRSVPQPPSSPLSNKLRTHLGRDLLEAEANYVRLVQGLYANAGYRPLAEPDLMTLSVNPPVGLGYDYWQKLDLWPTLPADDYAFWLNVAFELRRRKLSWPAFLDGITDLSAVEASIRDWQRQKEIEEWKGRFREFQPRAAALEPELLDLRLAVFPTEARLQWRTSATAPFADLKQSQAKKLAEQFERGGLTVAPEALPIWSATYKPWSYTSWWSFRYDDNHARPSINRLLRLPLSPERFVTPAGQPLTRPSQPLRLELQPPPNGEEHYCLRLVTASGEAPPDFLCVLSGQPTLYLTGTALFCGPSAEALECNFSQSIPAGAVESAEGIRFLHATGVALPEHLQQRVRTVPLPVRVACKLHRPYMDSTTEDLVVTVTAEAPGFPEESLSPAGWETARSAKSKPPKSDHGTIVVYERQAQQHFPRLLEPLALRWDSWFGHWKVRVTKKLPEAFTQWLKSVPPEVQLDLDRELASLRDEPVSGTVSLDVAEAGIDWFDIRVALQVTDTTLTPEELKLLLGARGGFVRLGKKGWRRLQFNLSPEENEQLAQLGLHAGDFSDEPQRFHALQLAAPAAHRFLGPDRAEMIQQRVRELKARVAPELPHRIRATMRPYQTEGFHFLSYLATNRFGGVLADDMGLGKTLQTLAWLAWLRDQSRVQNPEAQVQSPEPQVQGRVAQAPAASLVVCPKSVMDNWRGEAERFYPELRVRLWQGAPAGDLAAAREGADLLVLNYAQLRSLSPEISQVNWQAVILDEAQAIKNPDSQTAQAARALKADHRLALTGTPIENRLLDLWSIFGFAMPGALGNRSHFLRRFDAKDDPLARRRLAARVRPFLLRRTKSQVAKDLPDRVEEDLFCDLEGQQKTLYQAELKRARQLILGLTTNQQLNQERFNILTSLLRLRQICCHPALVDAELRQAESAKLAALEDLLEPLMEEGHKVLVFSQFVSLLGMLRELMERRNWPCFYLAGDTENRGELVQQFQSAPGGAVFLISLKAGGFGLNLTAASYVVLFDPWWNPAVENQAIDRTHRIGQTSKVIAYRLLMRESIEQKIRLLQKQKAALVQDVLGEERFAQSLTLEDLRVLFAE